MTLIKIKNLLQLITFQFRFFHTKNESKVNNLNSTLIFFGVVNFFRSVASRLEIDLPLGLRRRVQRRGREERETEDVGDARICAEQSVNDVQKRQRRRVRAVAFLEDRQKLFHQRKLA